MTKIIQLAVYKEQSAPKEAWYKYTAEPISSRARPGTPSYFLGLTLRKGDYFKILTTDASWKVVVPAQPGRPVQNLSLLKKAPNSALFVKKLKARAKATTEPTAPAAAPKAKPVTKNAPTSATGDSALDKLLTAWWATYRRYRNKFPATSAAHIKVFTALRDWSQVSTDGEVTLYRGSQLRGGEYKTGAKIVLKHARGLVSFSSKAGEAKKFALFKNKQGKAVMGTTYVLMATIDKADVLVSAGILKAVAKRLSKLGMTDEAESFADEAYDLAQHEAESFVLVGDQAVVVKQKYVDQKLVR